MTEARKNAFRRVLYAAMLDFRTHGLVPPAQPNVWIKPWLWPRIVRRLRAIQETAEWLHNLAQFASNDFKAFREEPFWKEYTRLLNRYPAIERTMYRVYFEYDGGTEGQVPARAWGVCGDA